MFKRQLVIVCRDVQVDWKQFVNPIYVAVESGLKVLLRNNFNIAFACGDFDELLKNELEQLLNTTIKQFPVIISDTAKDFLDSELAIIEAQKRKIKFDQIVIISDGPRWDMIIAQLQFLNKYKNWSPILLSPQNYLFLQIAPATFIFPPFLLQYNYISLFPFNCAAVTYQFDGCKFYDQKEIVINNKDVLAVSNEFTFSKELAPTLKIKKGTCLVALTKK